jgi:hypothetical protein
MIFAVGINTNDSLLNLTSLAAGSFPHDLMDTANTS